MNFKPRDRVVYVPYHANGDRSHKDCRYGTVSSTNDSFVFVRFDEMVSRLGWDGATSQACKPDQLELVGAKVKSIGALVMFPDAAELQEQAEHNDWDK